MAYSTIMGNYVKFLRCTPAIWDKIADSDKDKDSLYFVCAPGDASGSLYLGQQLISGNFTGHLGDFNDIELSDVIPDNSVLVFNEETQKWENRTIQEALALSFDIMVGATASKDGVAGIVPAPTAGQQNLFLRGDGTWAEAADAMPWGEF